MKIVAIVLSFNEEKHIRRCLESIQKVTMHFIVVDCYSTDRTCYIATSLGARVLKHPFVNYATQFNWAIGQVESDTDWILRIDADEYITPELSAEINRRLPELPTDVDGVFFHRSFVFMGREIRHGGSSRISALRLWRLNRGKCENRWMDEHIKVGGRTVSFAGQIIDHNLNSLTWWTAKHNNYSSREAVDLLNLKYGFMPTDTIASLSSTSRVAIKRWFKENLYAKLPGGLRALGYFFYRYFLALGFLDGKAGLVFHFLQGFWYRFLVDAKVYEVKRYMEHNRCDILQAIEQVLGIKVLTDCSEKS
jgi:glycosyltransferase involved in cell wall biosynthesis